jgi:hypothetical protein
MLSGRTDAISSARFPCPRERHPQFLSDALNNIVGPPRRMVAFSASHGRFNRANEEPDIRLKSDLRAVS